MQERVTIKINPGSQSRVNTAAATHPTPYHYTGNVAQPTQDPKKRVPNERSLPAGFQENAYWQALGTKCFEKRQKEYNYKFCPFKDMTQLKPGYTFNVNMGIYDSWMSGENNMTMLFTDGDGCANNKKRSTKVHYF